MFFSLFHLFREHDISTYSSKFKVAVDSPVAMYISRYKHTHKHKFTTHRCLWHLPYTNRTILNPALGLCVYGVCLCQSSGEGPSVVRTTKEPQNTSVRCGLVESRRLEGSNVVYSRWINALMFNKCIHYGTVPFSIFILLFTQS